MEVRWRISGRCKNVTRHKFGGIFGHVMTKISLSKVTIRSYLGLSGGSPPDARTQECDTGTLVQSYLRLAS